jgi:hypothetical protein
MPIRMLRDWTGSDKVNGLSVYAERFFLRLIMKVDDYGCFYADARLLKANLFPLLLDNIREADLLRWMAECQKAGLIVLYEVQAKQYVQIQNFKQRLDKARNKFPLPDSTDFPEVVNEFPAETETEKKPKNTTAAAADSESDLNLKGIYNKLDKSKASIFQFIKANNPKFIEPYVDLWNLFAKEKGLSPVTKITDSRKRKFNVRITETSFNFIEVLRKAGQSEFLLTGKWFGFDWLIVNDSNYLKVIEGNYDAKQQGTAAQSKKEIVL